MLTEERNRTDTKHSRRLRLCKEYLVISVCFLLHPFINSYFDKDKYWFSHKYVKSYMFLTLILISISTLFPKRQYIKNQNNINLIEE